MATILITGASGFVGSHVLSALLKEGHHVVALKKSSTDTWRISSLTPHINVYDIDITSIKSIFFREKIDYIIHLATCYRKQNYRINYRRMLESNITFPIELVENAIDSGVKGIINTGTFFEVDCSQQPIKENATLRPFNFYARTKIIFDTFLKSHQENLTTITLRLFSPYGERDNEKLIPFLMKKSINKKRVELSQGLQKLDFTYIKDIADAYIKSISRLENITTPYHTTYNIGTGNATSIREIVSILEELLGYPLDVSWGQPSPDAIPIAYATIEKARKDLHWEPKHTIYEGLKKTLSHYLDEYS